MAVVATLVPTWRSAVTPWRKSVFGSLTSQGPGQRVESSLAERLAAGAV
jgi:hypothetical protein